MSQTFEVVSVNVSVEKGTVKLPQPAVEIDGRGLVGDAHAGPWHRQVSLLDEASRLRFHDETGREAAPGAFGENLTLRGLPAAEVAPLDRLSVGEVELEVTQIGKACHGTGCEIFHQVGRCVMPSEGLFARVRRGGRVAAGDRGVYHPRALKVLVVTLSDRAAAGVYPDRSGPRVCELLEKGLAGSRWHLTVESRILPDCAEDLHRTLTEALAGDVDAVFTTGGTGVGARDVTPEVVAGLCERLVPGIVEQIRTKHGAANPRARLSRAVAGVAGTTQLYALPGSVRAVEEYVPEILATFDHLLLMLHGVDAH